MNKEAKVNNLILNGGFVESDRPFLMSLDDAGLTRLESYATAQVEAVQQAVTANQQATENEEDEPVTFGSIGEFIASGPVEYQEPLKLGLAAFNERKAAAVKVITANKANKLPVNELNALSLNTLETLAAFSKPAKTTENEEQPDYSGQAPVDEAAGKVTHNEAPLPTPRMDFTKKQ